MTDVSRPPEQVEKLHPESGQREMLEKNVSTAPPASDQAKPEGERPDHAVKSSFQPKPTEAKAQLEAKVGRPAESGVSGESKVVGKVNGTQIEEYAPSTEDRQAILGRVEQNWGHRKLDDVPPDSMTNQEREGLGVESAVQKMQGSGEYSDLEPMGGKNKPDILALDKDGRLCVVECKGHASDVKDAGYINGNGEKAGNLASETRDGVYFENEPAWLERNRPHMQRHLEAKIDNPTLPAGERAKSQQLLDALKDTDFYDQDSYRRMTVTAGPRAEYGNVTDYVREVRPEKMVQVRLPLKA